MMIIDLKCVQRKRLGIIYLMKTQIMPFLGIIFFLRRVHRKIRYFIKNILEMITQWIFQRLHMKTFSSNTYPVEYNTEYTSCIPNKETKSFSTFLQGTNCKEKNEEDKFKQMSPSVEEDCKECMEETILNDIPSNIYKHSENTLLRNLDKLTILIKKLDDTLANNKSRSFEEENAQKSLKLVSMYELLMDRGNIEEVNEK